MQELNERHRLAPARWTPNWKRRDELNISRALVFRFFFGIARRKSLEKRKASCWGLGIDRQAARVRKFCALRQNKACFLLLRMSVLLVAADRRALRKAVLLSSRLGSLVCACAMDERHNSILSVAAENSRLVSFSDAARFLGLDTFTFYALVQREEIPSVLAPSGEFVVLQDDLDRLVRKESPC